MPKKKKPDFTEVVRILTEYQTVRRSLAAAYPPGQIPPVSSPCPDDPAALCKALMDWFGQYYAWALSVEDRLPGGPGDTTPPPPPPFK